MEEKDNINNEIEKEKEAVHEKAATLSEIGSTVFIEPENFDDDDEKLQEKEILAYPDTVASPEVKKELIEASKRADRIIKPTDGGVPFGAKETRKGMKKVIQKQVSFGKKEERTKQLVKGSKDSKDSEQIR